MNYYFIEWENMEGKFGRSPYSLPEWRALDLIEIGNIHFKRAFHYLGKQDVKKSNTHPEYKEVRNV